MNTSEIFDLDGRVDCDDQQCDGMPCGPNGATCAGGACPCVGGGGGEVHLLGPRGDEEGQGLFTRPAQALEPGAQLLHARPAHLHIVHLE